MDLGMTYDNVLGCDGSVVGENKKHYPTVHIETSDELDIPDEGTVTFKFRKKGAEWRKKDDGKERYSCTLELKELVKSRKKNSEKEDGEDKLPSEETENALDAIVISISTGEKED